MKTIFWKMALMSILVMCSLAFSPVEQQGEHRIHLPVIFQAGGGEPGQPVLKWAYGGCHAGYCDTGWYSSPAILDFDGDGLVEIVAAQEHVFFLSGGNGQFKYLPYPLSGRAWPGVVAGDLDGDDRPDIVVADGNGWLYRFDYSSSLLNYEYVWVKTEDNCINETCYEVRSLAAGDLDGDGPMEIVTASTQPHDQWKIYRANGMAYPGDWPQHGENAAVNGYAAGCYNENIALGDVFGNHQLEIVGPSDVHYISVFQENGAQVTANSIFGLLPNSTPKPWGAVGIHKDHEVDLRGYADCGAGELRPNFANSAPVIADVNRDGIHEIIVVGNMYNCDGNYTDLYYIPYIFNGDRTRWKDAGFDWGILPAGTADMQPLSEDYSVIENAMPNPVVVDLDGDGLLEILYASYDGKIHAFWLDKTEHANWPIDVNVGEPFMQFASEPAVVDLQGDGEAEILFTTWFQKGSNQNGYLYIARWDGSILFRVELPDGDLNSTWNGALGAPTVGNIDADPDMEVIINSAHSGILAYDIPNTPHATLLWPTGRANTWRDGKP